MVQVMDFGYPQFTEAKILSEYIKTDAHKMEVHYGVAGSAHARNAYKLGLRAQHVYCCICTFSCNVLAVISSTLHVHTYLFMHNDRTQMRQQYIEGRKPAG